MDIFVAKALSLSRAFTQRLIKEGKIKVEGESAKCGYRLKKGELINYEVPEPEWIEAEEGEVDVLFEDDDILAVNKPAGVLTHPTPSKRYHTLINFLLYSHTLCSIGAPYRPGVVHRLDKDTSGVIIFAKSQRAYKSLVEQFKRREVKKVYLAVVHGVFEEEKAWISAPIAKGVKEVKIASYGKDALTHFEVLKVYKKGYTLLEVHPISGRTHQIRVHLAFVHHPIVGDRNYAKGREHLIKRVALHAKSLSFMHPATEKKTYIEAPLPKDFEELLRYLEDA